MERINNDKAIEFLLMKEWEKEFIVEEKLNQHKDGLSFEEWCRNKKFVEEWRLA